MLSFRDASVRSDFGSFSVLSLTPEALTAAAAERLGIYPNRGDLPASFSQCIPGKRVLPPCSAVSRLRDLRVTESHRQLIWIKKDESTAELGPGAVTRSIATAFSREEAPQGDDEASLEEALKSCVKEFSPRWRNNNSQSIAKSIVVRAARGGLTIESLRFLVIAEGKQRDILTVLQLVDGGGQRELGLADNDAPRNVILRAETPSLGASITSIECIIDRPRGSDYDDGIVIFSITAGIVFVHHCLINELVSGESQLDEERKQSPVLLRVCALSSSPLCAAASNLLNAVVWLDDTGLVWALQWKPDKKMTEGRQLRDCLDTPKYFSVPLQWKEENILEEHVEVRCSMMFCSMVPRDIFLMTPYEIIKVTFTSQWQCAVTSTLSSIASSSRTRRLTDICDKTWVLGQQPHAEPAKHMYSAVLSLPSQGFLEDENFVSMTNIPNEKELVPELRGLLVVSTTSSVLLLSPRAKPTVRLALAHNIESDPPTNLSVISFSCLNLPTRNTRACAIESTILFIVAVSARSKLALAYPVSVTGPSDGLRSCDDGAQSADDIVSQWRSKSRKGKTNNLGGLLTIALKGMKRSLDKVTLPFGREPISLGPPYVLWDRSRELEAFAAPQRRGGESLVDAGQQAVPSLSNKLHGAIAKVVKSSKDELLLRKLLSTEEGSPQDHDLAGFMSLDAISISENKGQLRFLYIFSPGYIMELRTSFETIRPAQECSLGRLSSEMMDSVEEQITSGAVNEESVPTSLDIQSTEDVPMESSTTEGTEPLPLRKLLEQEIKNLALQGSTLPKSSESIAKGCLLKTGGVTTDALANADDEQNAWQQRSQEAEIPTAGEGISLDLPWRPAALEFNASKSDSEEILLILQGEWEMNGADISDRKRKQSQRESNGQDQGRHVREDSDSLSGSSTESYDSDRSAEEEEETNYLNASNQGKTEEKGRTALEESSDIVYALHERKGGLIKSWYNIGIMVPIIHLVAHVRYKFLPTEDERRSVIRRMRAKAVRLLMDWLALHGPFRELIESFRVLLNESYGYDWPMGASVSIDFDFPESYPSDLDILKDSNQTVAGRSLLAAFRKDGAPLINNKRTTNLESIPSETNNWALYSHSAERRRVKDAVVRFFQTSLKKHYSKMADTSINVAIFTLGEFTDLLTSDARMVVTPGQVLIALIFDVAIDDVNVEVAVRESVNETTTAEENDAIFTQSSSLNESTLTAPVSASLWLSSSILLKVTFLETNDDSSAVETIEPDSTGVAADDLVLGPIRRKELKGHRILSSLPHRAMKRRATIQPEGMAQHAERMAQVHGVNQFLDELDQSWQEVRKQEDLLGEGLFEGYKASKQTTLNREAVPAWLRISLSSSSDFVAIASLSAERSHYGRPAKRRREGGPLHVSFDTSQTLNDTSTQESRQEETLDFSSLLTPSFLFSQEESSFTSFQSPESSMITAIEQEQSSFFSEGSAPERSPRSESPVLGIYSAEEPALRTQPIDTPSSHRDPGFTEARPPRKSVQRSLGAALSQSQERQPSVSAVARPSSSGGSSQASRTLSQSIGGIAQPWGESLSQPISQSQPRLERFFPFSPSSSSQPIGLSQPLPTPSHFPSQLSPVAQSPSSLPVRTGVPATPSLLRPSQKKRKKASTARAIGF